MAALLPTASLSAIFRQQSTSLPLRFNSSSAILSRKPFSTSSSSSVSRLGHGTVTPDTLSSCPFQKLTKFPEPQTRRSSLTSSPSHYFNNSPYTSQTARSITVQARPPQSTQSPPANPPSKTQTPSSTQTSTPQSPKGLPLTNLPYFIRRTPSNQLPVYIVTKSGGTRQQTKIQKTEGDLEALRSDLARALGLESKSTKSPDVFINHTNGHIVVKVKHHPQSTISTCMERRK